MSFPDPAVTRPRRQVHTQAVLDRCAAAEEALRSAVAEAGTMVESDAITVAWSSLATLVERVVPRRIARALAPAIKAGRVEMVKANRHFYFAPAGRDDLRPPAYASDLHRVEEALARATARLRSAVLHEEVEREVRADPDLVPRSQDVAYCLGVLRRCGRVRTVRPFKRMLERPYYYTLPDGPRWVRPEAEHHFDRRLRAVHGLWRASGGRPFTTRALRRYARCRASLWIGGEPPYAWTNALHQLLDAGDLVRIPISGTRMVLWAPAAAWHSLPEGERHSRLEDRSGRTPEAPAAVTRGAVPTGLPVHDVRRVSANYDARSLVLAAQVDSASTFADAELRAIILARPVTVKQVAAAQRSRPAVGGGAPGGVKVLLQQAARLRTGAKTSAVVKLGTVGRETYYAARKTEAGEAYVAFRRAVWEAQPRAARATALHLTEAARQARSGVVPLPEVVLSARAAELAARCREAANRLRTAAAETRLLPDEAQAAGVTIQLLESIADEVDVVLAGDHELVPEAPPTPAGVEAPLLSCRAASDQLDGLVSKGGGAHVGMSNRFRYIHVVRVGLQDAVRVSKYGRGNSSLLDRVAFACYTSMRWGGPTLSATAHRAWHGVGALRDSAPFAAALRVASDEAGHMSAASVLGFFDDPISRDALADYLRRSTCGDGRIAAGTTVPAAEAAAYGLAPLPFGGVAVALRDDERSALGSIAMKGADERLRWVAARVIAAWDEGWGRDRLLHL